MRWPVCIVVVPWWLAACARHDETAPFAESRTPPGLAERFYPPEGWTWGLVQVGGAPAQRYGVSGAQGLTRADILILPDYGETAETWFETARDLNARGYRVWVLEAPGQGGSGRWGSPRDLGDEPSFAADEAGVHAMVSTVIRPAPQAPLVLLAEGVEAATAIGAESARPDASGLILSAPRLAPPPPIARWMLDALHALRLDRARAPGGSGWRRPSQAAVRAEDRWRRDVTWSWQHANPDLRMGGPSVRWRLALREADLAAKRELPTVKAHVVTLAEGPTAPELAPDGPRNAWLAAVDAFVEGRLAASPAPAGAFQGQFRPIASPRPGKGKRGRS